MPAHEIIKPLPRVGRRAACQRGQDRRCEDQAQKCLEFPHIVMIENFCFLFVFVQSSGQTGQIQDGGDGDSETPRTGIGLLTNARCNCQGAGHRSNHSGIGDGLEASRHSRSKCYGHQHGDKPPAHRDHGRVWYLRHPESAARTIPRASCSTRIQDKRARGHQPGCRPAVDPQHGPRGRRNHGTKDGHQRSAPGGHLDGTGCGSRRGTRSQGSSAQWPECRRSHHTEPGNSEHHGREG